MKGAKDRTRPIIRRLKKQYPDAGCSLTHRSPLQLLVATILSAQCTDERVNLDEKITGALQNWEMGRVSIVDKNILRFALAEIMFFPQVPSKVIVNEAIEIAHKFSSRDAGKFVNGILDRFIRELREEEA